MKPGKESNIKFAALKWLQHSRGFLTLLHIQFHLELRTACRSRKFVKLLNRKFAKNGKAKTREECEAGKSSRKQKVVKFAEKKRKNRQETTEIYGENKCRNIITHNTATHSMQPWHEHLAIDISLYFFLCFRRYFFLFILLSVLVLWLFLLTYSRTIQ